MHQKKFYIYILYSYSDKKKSDVVWFKQKAPQQVFLIKSLQTKHSVFPSNCCFNTIVPYMQGQFHFIIFIIVFIIINTMHKHSSGLCIEEHIRGLA